MTKMVQRDIQWVQAPSVGVLSPLHSVPSRFNSSTKGSYRGVVQGWTSEESMMGRLTSVNYRNRFNVKITAARKLCAIVSTCMSCHKLYTQFTPDNDLLSWSYVYHSVWSVITADNFTAAKREESFSAMFTEP